MAVDEPQGLNPDWTSPQARAAVASLIDAYGTSIFMGDGVAVASQVVSFSRDRIFVEAFKSSNPDANEAGWAWRLHTLVWAAKTVLSVPGDFVECGVFRGFMSQVVCKVLKFETVPRQFWLYDTFAGLAESRSSVEERDALNAYYEKSRQEGYVYDEVLAKFSAYPNVKVMRGIVPDVFASGCPRRIAYLHIDMNAIAAEIAALDALFAKVTPGGIVVLDDYGRNNYADMHRAERAWFRARGYPVLELPSGQGLVVKR